MAKPVHSFLLLLCLVTVYARLASGQAQPGAPEASDVRITSSFVAAGAPVPEECREEARTFARVLIQFPLPNAWHWVLVCDEVGWRRFLRLSGREEQSEIYASTDLDGHTTYIRGAKLLVPYDFNADPRAVIGHELAHIRLRSRDEQAAGLLAQLWRSEPVHWRQ